MVFAWRCVLTSVLGGLVETLSGAADASTETEPASRDKVGTGGVRCPPDTSLRHRTVFSRVGGVLGDRGGRTRAGDRGTGQGISVRFARRPHAARSWLASARPSPGRGLCGVVFRGSGGRTGGGGCPEGGSTRPLAGGTGAPG